jgi:hypothetical protein
MSKARAPGSRGRCARGALAVGWGNGEGEVVAAFHATPWSRTMRRICFLIFLTALPLLAGCATPRETANIEVRTTGDALVYGVYSRTPAASGRR